MNWTTSTLVAALLVSVGCSDTVARSDVHRAPPSVTTAATAPAKGLPPSFDIDALVRRAHYAFRPQAGAYLARHESYSARVEQGVLQISSRAVPTAAKSERPLTIQLARVLRGDQQLDTTLRAARGTNQGGLELELGEVTEELLNTSEGVEQSFHFARAPGGHGDAVVEVEAVGEPSAEQTPTGLRFKRAHGAANFRYGDATWVDAAGTRTTVRAQWQSGRVRLVVPEQVVESTVFPAVLDPLIGPEFEVDRGVPGERATEQASARVASDGDGFLVVWTEFPAGVFGARVSKTGQVLDPAALEFAAAAVDADVASNGSGYVVTWAGVDATSGITGVHVGADGSVGSAFTVAAPVGSTVDTYPNIASNGTDYLAVWVQGAGLFAAKINGNGTSNGVPFPVGGLNADLIGVAGTPAGYLVVWGSNNGIVGARVTPAGIVKDTSGTVISSASSGSQAVGSDGTDFLVTWVQSGNLVGTRVGWDFSIKDPKGITIDNSKQVVGGASIVGNAGGYALAWPKLNVGTQFARVSSAGAVDKVGGDTLPGGNQYGGETGVAPIIASNGAAYLVAERSSNGRLYGVLFSAPTDFGSLTPFLLAKGRPDYLISSVARSKDSYLLVWSEESQAVCARVDLEGTLLDPQGILLPFKISHGSNGEPSGLLSPLAASDGTDYLIAGENSQNLLIALQLTGQGALGPNPIQLFASIGNKFDLAGNPQGYLIVQEIGIGTGLAASYVSASGTAASVPFKTKDPGAPVQLPQDAILSALHSSAQQPLVASDGTNFAVIWHYYAVWNYDFPPSGGGGVGSGSARYGLMGSRVSGLGVQQDLGNQVLDFDFPGGIADVAPLVSLASDGVGYLAVWQNPSLSAEANKFHGLLLDAQLTAATSQLFEIPITQHGCLQAASDGNSFLVEHGAVASLLSSTGALLDPPEFNLAASDPVSCAVAGGKSQYLAAYSTAEPIDHLHARLIGLLGNGAPCSGPEQCASNSCVSSACAPGSTGSGGDSGVGGAGGSSVGGNAGSDTSGSGGVSVGGNGGSDTSGSGGVSIGGNGGTDTNGGTGTGGAMGGAAGTGTGGVIGAGGSSSGGEAGVLGEGGNAGEPLAGSGGQAFGGDTSIGAAGEVSNVGGGGLSPSAAGAIESAGEAGDSRGSTTAPDSCSCRVAGSQNRSSTQLLILSGAIVALARGRRRATRARFARARV